MENSSSSSQRESNAGTSSSGSDGASAPRKVFRLRAIVRGRVQGVGFRYWTHHTARHLPITGGTVRNLPDGTVEVVAEAADKAPLTALFYDLHRGPTASQVTAVSAEWEENAEPRFFGFRVAD